MENKEVEFTRKEVSLLTNLTLRQVRFLLDKEIINPKREPIRFSFNQLVYCGIFSLLREKFSWDDSVNYLNSCIRTFEKGIPSDIVKIYPGYGTIHTGYAKQDDINKIVNEGVLTKTLINQKVDMMLLPTKKIVVNDIIEYYTDDIIIDEVFVIYLVNLIVSFRNKAEKNSRAKLTAAPDLNLGNCVA